ncbi:hypothetical protein [Actinomadura terrae]|uniref:hypothetical protein n=1 Tax=Actinomadura terrae TaxID=604353 RepID=UPI001FA76817|nr:hypothetical protein [Actinomadura terrae]
MVLTLVTGGIVGLGVGISSAVGAVLMRGVGLPTALAIGCVVGIGTAIFTGLKAAVLLNQLVAEKPA